MSGWDSHASELDGLGGAAPHPGSPAVPWLLTVGAGGLLALAGGFAARRARHRPLHVR